MSRLSNLNTLKIGTFGTWFSNWFDNEYYSFLIHKDLRILEFLNSIFYRYNFPTTSFKLNRISTHYYLVETNIYIFRPFLKHLLNYSISFKFILKFLLLFSNLLDYIFIASLDNYLESDVYIKNKYTICSSSYSWLSFITQPTSYSFYFYILNYLFFSNLSISFPLVNVIDENIIQVTKIQYKIYFSYFFSNVFKSDNLYKLNDKVISRIILYLVNIYSFLFKLIGFNSNIIFNLKLLFNSFKFLILKIKLINNYKVLFFLNSINFKSNKTNDKDTVLHSSYFRKKIKQNIFQYKTQDLHYYLINKYFVFYTQVNNDSFGFFGHIYMNNFSIQTSEDSNDLGINERSFFKFLTQSRYFVKSQYFFNLHKNIENSIFSFTGIHVFFFPTYFNELFPMLDSKFICDFFIFHLIRRLSVRTIMKKVSLLQRANKKFGFGGYLPFFREKNIIIENDKSIFKPYLSKKLINFYSMIKKYYTLQYNIRKYIMKKNSVYGIRIECSGPPKKAKMSKTYYYSNMIQDHRLIGKMPSHTVRADIQYYQSNATLKRSLFGIKVWVYYYTPFIKI